MRAILKVALFTAGIGFVGVSEIRADRHQLTSDELAPHPSPKPLIFNGPMAYLAPPVHFYGNPNKMFDLARPPRNGVNDFTNEPVRRLGPREPANRSHGSRRLMK
jgi:hypothetical protein